MDTVVKRPLAIRNGDLPHSHTYPYSASEESRGTIHNQGPAIDLHQNDGNVVMEDTWTELQDAIEVCKNSNKEEASKIMKATVEKQPNDVKRGRGRPKKRVVRQNNKCMSI